MYIIECHACKYPNKYTLKSAKRILIYKKGQQVKINDFGTKYLCTAMRDMYNVELKCKMCGAINYTLTVNLYDDYFIDVPELKDLGWDIKHIKDKHIKKQKPKKRKQPKKKEQKPKSCFNDENPHPRMTNAPHSEPRNIGDKNDRWWKLW